MWVKSVYVQAPSFLYSVEREKAGRPRRKTEGKESLLLSLIDVYRYSSLIGLTDRQDACSSTYANTRLLSLIMYGTANLNEILNERDLCLISIKAPSLHPIVTSYLAAGR